MSARPRRRWRTRSECQANRLPAPTRLPGKDFHLPAPVSISCSHYALLPAAERDRNRLKDRDGETHRDKDGCRRHLQIASGTGQKELLQFASIIAVDRRGFDTVKINYVIVKADPRKRGVHCKKLRKVGGGYELLMSCTKGGILTIKATETDLFSMFEFIKL